MFKDYRKECLFDQFLCSIGVAKTLDQIIAKEKDAIRKRCKLQ